MLKWLAWSGWTRRMPSWIQCLAPSQRWRGLLPVVCGMLAGCVSDSPPSTVYTPASPNEARALIARLIPPSVSDRNGWARDIYAALTTLEIPATPDYICSVVAITDQESNFRVDPAVPKLATIAWREIDKQRERAGVPEAGAAGRPDAAVPQWEELQRAHRHG